MNVALGLGWAVGIALVAIGICALAAPHRLARSYGVRTEGDGAAAFIRATGIRDVALGVALGATAYFHLVALLVVLAVAGIAVSAADFAIAYHHGTPKRLHPAHGMHAAGIVAFILILAMALFAVGR